jgi:hypothetical protein
MTQTPKLLVFTPAPDVLGVLAVAHVVFGMP